MNKSSCLLFVLLLIGCSVAPVPSPTIHGVQSGIPFTRLPPTMSPSPSASPTHTIPTASPSPVMIETPPTPSPTLVPSPTATLPIPEEARLTIRCAQLLDQFPPDAALTGTVVLRDPLVWHDFLLDLPAGNLRKFPEEIEGIMGVVSPDRTLLAGSVGEYPEYQLVITRADGKPLKILPLPAKWGPPEQWLDNKHLLIHPQEPGPDIVLNAFTGEWREFSVDLPDEDLYYGLRFWHSPVYDPTLTRLVYQSSIGDEQNRGRIVLWDIRAKQLITRLSSDDVYGNMPVWSVDGQQFAIALRTQSVDELYRVSRDGQVTRLTNLGAYYSTFLIIWNYSWSIDAQKIALWIDYTIDYTVEGINPELAVLDLNNGEVVNYCIQGRSSAPVWSPDGRYLAVDSYDDDKPGERMILLDIEEGWAVHVADNMWPIGWMVNVGK